MGFMECVTILKTALSIPNIHLKPLQAMQLGIHFGAQDYNQ